MEEYEKLLSEKLTANLGYVYENLVAQMLTAGGNKLLSQRYLLYTKDLMKDGNTLLLPFYMIPFIIYDVHPWCESLLVVDVPVWR